VKSDNLSSLVRSELDIERPFFSEGRMCSMIQNKSKLFTGLIGLSRKDTLLIKQLLEHRNVLSVAQGIARITGLSWSQVMWDSPTNFIESYLMNSLFQAGFLLPDKRQLANNVPDALNCEIFVPGLSESSTVLFAIPFWQIQLIRQSNICFTTLRMDGTCARKPRGVLPAMISELLNSLDKLEGTLDKAELRERRVNVSLIEAIRVIAVQLPRYFTKGSRRFPIAGICTAFNREFQTFKQTFASQILVLSDQFAIVQTDSPERVIQLFSSRYPTIRISVNDTFERALIENVESYAGLSSQSSQIIRFNFHSGRWNSSPAAQELCDNILKVVLISTEIDLDLLELLQTFQNSLATRPVQDFVIPCYFSEELSYPSSLARFAQSLEEKGLFDPCNDLLHFIRTQTLTYRRPTDVHGIHEIDIQWYILHEFIPIFVSHTQRFCTISQSQLWDCFGIRKPLNLILKCPN
jgi:hypothetical protein